MSNDQFTHSSQEWKPKQENSWKIHQVHNVKILPTLTSQKAKNRQIRKTGNKSCFFL